MSRGKTRQSEGAGGLKGVEGGGRAFEFKRRWSLSDRAWSVEVRWPSRRAAGGWWGCRELSAGGDKLFPKHWRPPVWWFP